ncbi:MAG: hypothetical protein Kow0010_19450 [Dehalococcoidia bacterium]
MTDPVRLAGFFAPFDIDAVLSQLREARETRLLRLDVDKARADVRQQLIADIATKLSSLLGAAKKLTATSSVLRKSTSVAGSGVSAAASATASLGAFTVDVLKLATATKVTGSAISAGIDASSPMNQANFATVPTNGTYTIGTTANGSVTLTVGPAAVDSVSLLNASNFATAVTDGTFTITTAGGGSAQIAVDTATQSLNDVITAINNSGIGVTATITNDANGRANIITLSSANGEITLGDASDTSNFLSAAKLSADGSTTAISSSAAVATQMSLSQVIDEINNAGVGITATLENDANGRPNLVRLAAASEIKLGNATDTSNFLSAVNLLASPGTTTRESTQSIARLNPAEKMADAAWSGGPPASGQHTISINGVEIAYDVDVDSLNDVINRINTSGAGVTASYDRATDTVRLEQSTTGSMEIALADDGAGGDLLAKLGLLGATQTLGQNAEYSIDGGPTQYAASNTVTPVPGVTLTLTAATEPGSPATVTVSQDTGSAVNAIKDFVTKFNAAMSAIEAATRVNPDDLANSGELSGDASVRQLRSTLRRLITGAGLNVPGGLNSLADIGLDFGKYGAQVGTTNTLLFDEDKFTKALTDNPDAVQSLLSAFTLEATLEAGGTGSVTGISGNYAGTRSGRYTIVDDGMGTLTATFRADDGSPLTTTTATVEPGGSTTSLIPGLTVSVGDPLQPGEHVVRVTATSASPLQQVQQFLEAQAGSGGVLSRRQDAYSAISRDISERRLVIEERIERELERLREKFVAMEQAQARAQSILASLQSMTQQLNANRRN